MIIVVASSQLTGIGFYSSVPFLFANLHVLEFGLRYSNRVRAQWVIRRNATSRGESTHTWPDLPSVSEFENVAKISFCIEIVVFVLIVATALDHGIATSGEVGGSFLRVGIEKLDVVQQLPVLVEMLVIDRIAAHRLYQFDLGVAAPGAGNQV